MSESLTFQLFYGSGEVRYGPEGVDLSEFSSITKQVPRARERTWESITKWLYKAFRLDIEQHELSVMAVLNRSEVLFWELMPLEGTQNWRQYVTMATERHLPLVLLVRAFDKGGPSAEAHDEGDDGDEELVTPIGREEDEEEEENEDVVEGEQLEDDDSPLEVRGELDEGEDNPAIVEEFEREAEEHQRALEDDSSDDDDDDNGVQVPMTWPNYDFSQLTVNEGEATSWEYKENEVSLGACYGDLEDLKQAVKQWSTLCLQREFRVVKSSKKVYDICCVTEGCSFRLHAFRGIWKDYWEVSRIEEHTCELEQLHASHRNLTAGFVANFMYPHIVENPSFEPKSIICAIEEHFKYKISYGKAYRAKQKILEMRWGSYEASYDNLPKLLHTICQRNPGSFYDLKTFPCLAKPGKHVLQRAFLALGPCIEAFPHCRPVICIDGTFLTGRYKGTLLIAIAGDGNNQLLPLAIAFVEKESGDSWYWFLERLKQIVVRGVEDVCVIHDRHKGILQAIEDIKNGSFERRRVAHWPDIKSRWCMRHMAANFHNQFKNKVLMKLFKRLCAQNQEKKFKLIWKKLDDLTKKQTAALAKRQVNNEADLPVSLEDVGLDGPDVRRRRGRAIKTFSQWIENEPREKWALIYDEGGARHGIMTTNYAEAYNGVLRGARSLPLVGIIEFFVYRTIDYFKDRYAAAQKIMIDNHKIYGDKMTEYMDKAQKKALLHRASDKGTAERRYEVICRDKGRRGGRREQNVQECVLQNDRCVCSCQKPQLLHKPCTHVIAACLVAGGLPPRRFVPRYYFKETIWNTWKRELYGYHIVGSFTENPRNNATYIPDPDPEMFQGVGRRKKKRIRNNMDRSEAGADVVLCSKCHEPGHTYKRCTATSYGSSSTAGTSSNVVSEHQTRGRGRRGRRGRGSNDDLL